MAQGTERDFEMELESVAPQLGVPEAIDLDVFEGNAARLDELIRQWVTTLLTVGGVVYIAAKRAEYAPTLYETRQIIGKWDSWGGPAERLPSEPEEEHTEPRPSDLSEPAPAGG